MHDNDKSDVTDVAQNQDRRKAIKKIVTGVGFVVGCSVLPEKWTKPVVGHIILPAHAETSGPQKVSKFVALGDSIGARSPNWPDVVQSKSGADVTNYSQDSLKTGDFVGRINSVEDIDTIDSLGIDFELNNDVKYVHIKIH